MNTEIEFHDSKILSIDTDCSEVSLRAYVHRSEGKPGQAPGNGGTQLINLKFSEMHVEGKIGSLPSSIFEGSFQIADEIYENMMPFPAVFNGLVTLTVTLAPDARTITVSGNGLMIEANGDFEFLEKF